MQRRRTKLSTIQGHLHLVAEMPDLTKKVNVVLSQLFPDHTKKETTLNQGLQTGSLRARMRS